MAKILCITTGLTGILNASFELANRLEKAGHQVILSSPQSVGEKVRLNGFEYLQIEKVNFSPAPELPSSLGKIQRLLYKIKHRKERQKTAIENLGMQEFGEILKKISPDLLIIDVELHEHIMTAYSMKTPMILLSQWFSLWHRKGLPPLLEDTIPGKGFLGSSIGLALAWQKIKLHRWWMFFKKRMISAGTNRRSILKKYAQKVGFPKRFIRENFWPGPFTYAELSVIAMTDFELEFPHDVRPNLHYVGGMVFENRKELKTNPETEKLLNGIFEKVKKSNSKLIYCSVSTFKKGDTRFLEKVVKAVSQRSDWELIIGMGGMLEADFLQNIPENVHPFSWIPQMEVLKNVDLSINHGGIHTINECLHFGVPMLIYSGKRSDQNGCAARVHYHQLGIMGDKDLEDVEEIRGKIERVLEEDIFRKNIEKLNKKTQQNSILTELLMQII